jgi:Tfp pilus assembly protein PilN
MNRAVYRINLNKASNRLDQFEQQQKKRRVVAIGFFLFLLVAVTGVAVFFSLQTQKQINAYEAELDNINNEIDKLEASSQYLSPEDIFALAELANTRLTWTEKFNLLGKIIPSDVSITEIYYDYQLKSLRIKGVSKVKPNMRDLDLVVSIVDRIKNNDDFAKDFADIRFTSSTRVKRGEQDLVEFEIECLVG